MINTTTNKKDVIAPGTDIFDATYNNRINPCGQCAGETNGIHSAEEPGTPPRVTKAGRLRPHTVKGRKRGKGHRRHTKNPGGRTTQPNEVWQHPNRGTWEAAGILKDEGYTVGKTIGPDPAFDLMGNSPAGSILVKIVRPKKVVSTASGIRELYLDDILRLQPYYLSPADVIEIWVFSRETGLLRYRVFDWGIGNVRQMNKLIKKQPEKVPDSPDTPCEPANGQTRNSPCPASPTG